MQVNIRTRIQDNFLFLSRFLSSPGIIGSVTPSSKFLAKQMIHAVPWNQVYHVAELGAGTGAITKYIQEARRKDTKVMLFEQDARLRHKLQTQYAGCSCYEDCRELEAALRSENIKQLDCILSGLPFFNFPQEVRDRLVGQIVASLRPGGLFIAFQYSQQMKKQLSEHFEIEQIKFVPLNIPPAFVYICRKKG